MILYKIKSLAHLFPVFSFKLDIKSCLNSVTVSRLQFREATMSDKPEVLSLRTNVYRGLDYLPDFHNYFIKVLNRKCIVGYVGKEMVYKYAYCDRTGHSQNNNAYRHMRAHLIYSVQSHLSHILIFRPKHKCRANGNFYR